jgi:hypothetical protein
MSPAHAKGRAEVARHKCILLTMVKSPRGHGAPGAEASDSDAGAEQGAPAEAATGSGSSSPAAEGYEPRSLTAFARAEADLRGRLASASVDAASFNRPLSRCSLAHCRGMCCYDGVYVSDDEAEVIQALATREGEFFRAQGLELPEQVIVDGEWEGVVAGKKTAVVSHPFSREVPGFPKHFNDTACVFHMDDGRCALQVLSEAHGRHPWYYKPLTCWLHPISIAPGEGGQGAVVLLESVESDPYRVPGYDGYAAYTFCGRTDPCGQPASSVLDDEITFLSAIVGRNLAALIRAGAESGPAEPEAPPAVAPARRAPPEDDA